MVSDSLNELYRWAKSHLSRPVLLDYQLDKVNGQIEDKVYLLLRQADATRPGAEIEIDYIADRALPYLVSFSFLPFTADQPRPVQLRPAFLTQQQVIDWVMTGQTIG